MTDARPHSQLCFNDGAPAPRTPTNAYSPDRASLPGSIAPLEGMRSAYARVDSIVRRSYLARARSPAQRAVSPTLFSGVEGSGALADAVYVSGDDKVEAGG